MPVIFLVDPFRQRRTIIQQGLERGGYRVEVFATAQAFEIAEQQLASLIIVAIELPDGDGLALRERVRKDPALSSIPVILLADSPLYEPCTPGNSDPYNCLAFPLAPGDLIKAVETLLQKADEVTDRSSSSEGADIVIDAFAMRISVQGQEVATTTLEFRLLDYLARHHGKVLTRDALLDAVWGDLTFVTPRSVDACIRRIRRKIESQSSRRLLRTIRGTGYKLDAKPRWESAGGACDCTICTAARLRATAVAGRDFGEGFNSLRRTGIFPSTLKLRRLSS
jgi:two-component system phosphate regulon response regulator PhoB